MDIDDPPGPSTDSSVSRPIGDKKPTVDLERKRYLFERLKSKVEESPLTSIRRIPDDLLSNLATSLTDQTVINILVLLRLQQKNKEKELMNQRDQMISKLDTKLKAKIEQVEKQFALSEITSLKRDEILKEIKRHYEEKMIFIDMDIIHQVDKNVAEQQKTLKDAQIPGFYITNKSHEIEIQCKLLNMIAEIDDLFDESKLMFD